MCSVIQSVDPLQKIDHCKVSKDTDTFVATGDVA